MRFSECWAQLLQRGGLAALGLLALHCGSSQPHAAGVSGAGPTDGGGASNVAGAGAGAGGAGEAQGGRTNTSFGGAVAAIPGAPGCGLGDKAAFCDSFDAPASKKGRAGELDVEKWSGARQQPQAPTGGGVVIGIIPGKIPHCRDGVPEEVSPDDDTLICDPNEAIKSNHLLTACAAQNYGQNSYRIRQPFDFADRTGKIVFDGEGYNEQLLGWISVEITEDPTPGPSFALGSPGTANNEGSVVPRNAVEIQFQEPCEGQGQPLVTVSNIITVKNYEQTSHWPDHRVCKKAKQGSLNHFEIAISPTRVEVFGTDVSTDGSSFGELSSLLAIDIDLPFTRGYVSITNHNHATRKYSPNNALSAWTARWDNVGFDGPVLDDSREYEIPDSLVPATNSNHGNEAVTNIAYHVADAAKGPNPALHFKNVDLAGMSKARLAVSTWYLQSNMNSKYVLQYRLNGGAWHDRPLSADEAAVLSDTRCQGAMAITLDVPMTDLVSGDNSIEFQTPNIPQNYPPAISNIDLILSK
jgi:hypothetical protein